jgi:hypothetical protein
MRIVFLLPLLGLGGCAVSSYCEGEQDYQEAQSLPTLQTADGLQVRDSSTALRIPPPPATAVPYGETVKDEDGDDTVRCLDRPPDLPPVAAEPAGPAEPAPAAKPAG